MVVYNFLDKRLTTDKEQFNLVIKHEVSFFDDKFDKEAYFFNGELIEKDEPPEEENNKKEVKLNEPSNNYNLDLHLNLQPNNEINIFDNQSNKFFFWFHKDF